MKTLTQRNWLRKAMEKVVASFQSPVLSPLWAPSRSSRHHAVDSIQPPKLFWMPMVCLICSQMGFPTLTLLSIRPRETQRRGSKYAQSRLRGPETSRTNNLVTRLSLRGNRQEKVLLSLRSRWSLSMRKSRGAEMRMRLMSLFWLRLVSLNQAKGWLSLR